MVELLIKLHNGAKVIARYWKSIFIPFLLGAGLLFAAYQFGPVSYSQSTQWNFTPSISTASINGFNVNSAISSTTKNVYLRFSLLDGAARTNSLTIARTFGISDEQFLQMSSVTAPADFSTGQFVTTLTAVDAAKLPKLSSAIAQNLSTLFNSTEGGLLDHKVLLLAVVQPVAQKRLIALPIVVVGGAVILALTLFLAFARAAWKTAFPPKGSKRTKKTKKTKEVPRHMSSPGRPAHISSSQGSTGLESGGGVVDGAADVKQAAVPAPLEVGNADRLGGLDSGNMDDVPAYVVVNQADEREVEKLFPDPLIPETDSAGTAVSGIAAPEGAVTDDAEPNESVSADKSTDSDSIEGLFWADHDDSALAAVTDGVGQVPDYTERFAD